MGERAMTQRLHHEMALARKIPWTGRELEVRVVEADRNCVLGYHEVDYWAVDQDGYLTPNLCQGAAAAVSAANEAPWTGAEEERRVACRCPIPGREVTFSVRPWLPPAEGV